MMRHVMAALGAGIMLQASGAPGLAAESPDARQWLMMVRTVNTDPVKEREFNEWYDDIDIPDVLKVPGYWRARRARTLPGTAAAPAHPAEASEQGHYLALYNIESPAIDKTIIDMLMATWKMLSQGRDTPLLKVTERAYYHQYAAPVAGATAGRTDARHFLLLQRFDVAPGSNIHRFDSWYDRTYRHAIGTVPGLVRATRYELYRVLMFEPRYAPRFLTLFEVEANSEDQARASGELLANFAGEEGLRHGYLAAESTLYTQIKDVRR